MISDDAFRDQPTLSGKQIRLEPLSPRHIDDAYTNLGDVEATRMTGTHATFTRADIEAFTLSVASRDDRADWAIVRIEDGIYLGEVVLNQLDADNASVSFRISIGRPEHREQGYGVEATKLVLAYAFDVAMLHRVALEVYPFNPRAQHVYEKCGFQVEGRLRESLRWDGEWYDAIVMSILATDPR
jgi:RimJ/RimL family protein N-acetyltransferase